MARINKIKFGWILKIIVPLVSIIISLLVMEVAARLLGEDLSPPVPLTSYLPRPWGSIMAPGVAPGMVNSFGTFDREHAKEKPNGIKRIAFLGDSFLGLPTLPHERQVPQIVEQLLNGIGLDHYETLNFSVSSAGTVNEYLRYRYDARQFSPDLTLVFFTVSNDARNNSVVLQPMMEACPIPLPGYVLDHDGKLRFSSMPAAPGSYWYYRDPLSAWLVTHSALFRWVSRAIQMARGARASVPPPAQWKITASFLTRQPSSAVNDAWSVTDALIEDLRRMVEADHGRFAVVIIPTSWDIEEKWKLWLYDKLPRDIDKSSLDFDAPYIELIRGLEHQGISYLDLRPSFHDEFATSPERPLYDETGHWSATGHRVAAAATAEFVRGLMSPTPKE